MLTMNRFVSPALIGLSLLTMAGCPNKADPAPSTDAASPSETADATVTDAQLGPLATACAVGSDCASGFCVDGVCCDSACQGQCYACAQAGATGHCAAQTTGQDMVASDPCIGSSACFLDQASHLSVCRTVSGAACDADGDCGSGHCITYYVDADGDGYGTSDGAKFCGELNGQAPAGYAAYSGDCCDIDNGANPAFGSTTFLEFPDACGSYDWNCDGVVARQRTCSGQPSLACGAQCVLNFGFFSLPEFTEACN